MLGPQRVQATDPQMFKVKLMVKRKSGTRMRISDRRDSR